MMLQHLRYGKQYGYKMLFKRQPHQPVGKIGVIIGEMGLPEEYEFKFFNHFMQHVFNYSLPAFIKPMVLADRGIGLIDPENPLARHPFQPEQLIDPWGSFTNKAGHDYVKCAVEWRPPATPKNPWDHGFFLYKGDGLSGAPDVCDKVGAKICGWYYGKLLPEKKVAWRSQLRRVFDDSVTRLSPDYPDTEFRQAYYMDPPMLHQVVQELLADGCQTIIYQGINCPVYSDFEDYGYVLPMLHTAVNGKARIIMADQLGNQPAMREAYLAILRDRLSEIPDEASLFVILSAHGHPFKKETQDERALLYRDPLQSGVKNILSKRKGKGNSAWSFDEYADDYWDPKGLKTDTHDLYLNAIRAGYDYIIELPTDFPAENTDLMIFHAMKKFSAFTEYDRNQPVPYPDWENPLVRIFHEGKSTSIYAGTPVGPYRKYVVDAVVDSLGEVLTNKSKTI